jgi:hypothetical protein
LGRRCHFKVGALAVASATLYIDLPPQVLTIELGFYLKAFAREARSRAHCGAARSTLDPNKPGYKLAEDGRSG